jgi:hypothetical protein
MTDRVNFSDGNHAAHVQAFRAWLHPDLHNLPGIDWDVLPSSVLCRLVNSQLPDHDAAALALAIGSTAGLHLASGTLRGYVSNLQVILRIMRKRCDMQQINDLSQKRLWQRYMDTVPQGKARVNHLTAYTALVETYLPAYIQELDFDQRNRLQRFILPPPPQFIVQQYRHEISIVQAAAQQRRKKQSDVLTPLFSVLTAVVQHRFVAAKRFIEIFRQERQRVLAGDVTLPHTYSYMATVPEVNQEDAQAISEVQIRQRPIHVTCTIWSPQTWAAHHPDDFTGTRKRLQTQAAALGNTDLFLQFHGTARDLLWVGDLVEQRLFQRFHPRPSEPASEQARHYQRRARLAEEWGAKQGITTTSSSLLHSGGAFGRWFSSLPWKAGELLLEPESLWRGLLFGCALTTTILTNGARMGEVAQISLARAVQREIRAEQDGKPPGRQKNLYFQHLLPKGARNESERQLFLMSHQALVMIQEITQELIDIHGEIPVAEPHPQSAWRERLQPERYIFQWTMNTEITQRILHHTDIARLVRLAIHGIEMYTADGTPIRVVPHLLRHVMATAARHEYQVPVEAVAAALHHKPVEAEASAMTRYYSQMLEDDHIAHLHAFQLAVREQAEVELRVPDEATLAALDEKTQTAFKHWRALNPVPFGFCGHPGLCIRGDQSNLCIGCHALVPEPERIEQAHHWEKQYVSYASLLRDAESIPEAYEMEEQVWQLRDLINVMQLQQQAIDAESYIPLHRTLPALPDPDNEPTTEEI